MRTRGTGSRLMLSSISPQKISHSPEESPLRLPRRIAAVQHCIRAHRYRDNSEPPVTLEAKVLFDADKLDVLGAIGAARTIAYATLDGKPFYYPPSDKFLRSGQEEPGEPHSAYHEHLFKLRKVGERMFTAAAKAMAAERLAYLDAFFERLIHEWQGEL
mgnify:CR=1 FL=1